MWITPSRRLIPLRSTRLLLFAAFSLFFSSGALAQNPATAPSARPFFVPRDLSTGHPIPGPPLPHRLTELLDALNKLSDEQCLQLYREILVQPATEESEGALDKIFKAFAQSTRHVPLAQLLSVSDRVFIRKRWYNGACSLAVPWEETKPEETARWLADQGIYFLRDDIVVSDSISYAISYWGDKDARAASDFAIYAPLAGNLPSGWDPNTSFYWFLRKVVCRRSADDLPGALSWAEALPDTDRRRTVALLGVLDHMVKTDLSGAEGFVERQLSSNKDAPELAAQLVSDVADPSRSEVRMDSLGLWVLSLPDPFARRAALESLVSVWLTKIDTVWTQLPDLPKAAAWASSLSPGVVRGEAWGTVAALWGTKRPNTAKDWLRSLPEGPDRNAAMTAYDEAIIATAKEKFAGRHPEEAFYPLQMNLLDHKRAAELVQTMLSDWERKDPVKARAWATGHGMKIPTAATGNR